MKFMTSGYAGDLGGYEPIFVVRTGHCNPKALMSTLNKEQVLDYLHFSREIAFRKCDERTRKSRMLIKTIAVIDLAGFSLFAGDSRFEKCLQAASELSAIYYPQLAGKTVIMNMPSFFKALFRTSMALMPQSMRDKVAVCPQSNTAACGKTIQDCPFMRRYDGTRNCVPPFLGGAMDCPDRLLPRAELESALTRVTVASRSSTAVEFEVPARAAAAWEVVVEDFGIIMEAFFLPDENPLDRFTHGRGGGAGGAEEYVPRYGAPARLMGPSKIKAANGLAQGALRLPGKGLLRVVFDNSYSLLRSKTFDYRIRVAEDLEEAASASEGAALGPAATPFSGGDAGPPPEWDLFGLREETDNLLGQLGVRTGTVTASGPFANSS